MKAIRSPQLILASALIPIIILGCGALPDLGVSTPAPVATTVPTATALSLYQQVTLGSTSSEQDSQSPAYKITVQTPALTGSTDPRVVAFNDRVTGLIKDEIAGFMKFVPEMRVSSASPGSYFDIRYKLLSPPGNVFSLKFEMEGYIAGAAHPEHTSRSINYDLEEGRELALSDLFLPDSKYLETLSKYCVAELTKRQVGDGTFAHGADPTPDNYRNWNIAPDGLLITFDEYQVAAYAYGPQIVIVPYSVLKSMINPGGPLAHFTQ